MFPFQQQMPKCMTLQNVFCWLNVKDFSQSKMSKKASILSSHSLISIVIESIQQQLTAATAADAVWGSPSTSSAVHPGFAFQEETNNPGCRAKICLSLHIPALPCAAWAGTSCSAGLEAIVCHSTSHPSLMLALLEVKAAVGLPHMPPSCLCEATRTFFVRSVSYLSGSKLCFIKARGQKS